MADSLIQEFLVESTEGLDRLDSDLVALEKDPSNPALLATVFRVIHTIKGSCGFLGFTKLEGVAHAGESLLSLMRERKLDLNREIADALLAMVDAIRGILSGIGATGAEADEDYMALIENLNRLQKPRASLPNPQVASLAATPPPANNPAPPAARQGHIGKTVEPNRIGGALVRCKWARPEDIIRALEIQEQGDSRRLGEILIDMSVLSEAQLHEVLDENRQGAATDTTIRVDVNLLEKQMNLVGELVLVRNRLLQLAARQDDHNLTASVQGLNFVTSELRKNVMKTRMQPVNNLFEKLPRLVRDVACNLGKFVRLETLGGETELDKTLLEAIKDPVTHIVRNSVDHGIELPEVRSAAGKNPEGLLRMRAYHEGGDFHLDVEDDGAGIDVQRIKQKAVSRGLVSAPQADSLTEEQLLNFIFLPGFSTAEKVTNFSGRGVGMDVVRTNIERIGGSVKLESTRGHGTAIKLDIPLTLATIPALIVQTGRSVFAIPQACLVEMVCLDSADSVKKIATIDGVCLYRFRGTLVPLVSLRKELRLAPLPTEQTDDSVSLVILRIGGRQIGLRVDQIRHTEEIVIKPLGKLLKSAEVFSGAAVLGDGRVALILDVLAFARRAGIAARQDAGLVKATHAVRAPNERLSLLLLGGSNDERMAIPLPLVRRLEEFSASVRERMGGRDVVQYRGHILPLFHLEHLLEERRSHPRHTSTMPGDSAKISAVVVNCGERRNVLLEVHRILGIVTIDADTISPGGRRGVRGSTVIQGRATEVLDLQDLLARAEASVDLPVPVGAAPTEEIHYGR